MKKIRAGAFFAGAATALYLIWSGLRASGRSRTGSGERAGRGPVQIVVPLLLFPAAAVVVFYLMFANPRMRDQPKATPLRALLPATPEGTVAVAEVPPLEAVAQSRNPLPDTPQTRQAGQVYYGHYCAFCHGQNGHGDGPVGRSYVPPPADLTSPSVRNLSDGDLYRAMLTGTGHEPVLAYVVLPEALWYIVSYVRHLPVREGEQGNLTSVQQGEQVP